MRLFNITKSLKSALKAFEKAKKKDLEKVIEKSTKKYEKAQSQPLEAENVIKLASLSLGQSNKITEEE